MYGVGVQYAVSRPRVLWCFPTHGLTFCRALHHFRSDDTSTRKHFDRLPVVITLPSLCKPVCPRSRSGNVCLYKYTDLPCIWYLLYWIFLCFKIFIQYKKYMYLGDNQDGDFKLNILSHPSFCNKPNIKNISVRPFWTMIQRMGDRDRYINR